MAAHRSLPTIDQIRAEFPALARSTVFLENAGGSQVPRGVADAIRRYMLESYVQLGAGYPMSDAATATVDRAHTWVNRLVGGDDCGKVILGPSSTQLCYLLASCYADCLRPGDEIVLAETGHEANVGPWLRLERHGAVIRWWRVDRREQELTMDGLNDVLTPRTRLVAFPHVSNLLGTIVDVEEVARRAHAVGARVVVDGVAFAPHRAIDVKRWNVDWYVYSTYKVYGPHMGALFGTHDALSELTGPNHFFIPKDHVPYKFELGGASHEGCAAIVALEPYLAFLAGRTDGHADRATVLEACEQMTALETPLQERLIRGLAAVRDVRVIGRTTVGANERVPTVSFLHARRSPKDVVRALHDADIAVRHGHMYAHRLCTALGIDVTEGVVRISAVHYNTVDEIDRALRVVASL